MHAFRILLTLRRPLATLALCALLTQQMVGFVLTASPALAIESGFSLCLSGPPSADDDPFDMVDGAGFCPCTLQLVAGVLPPSVTVSQPPLLEHERIASASDRLNLAAPSTGPPPARAPPAALHS